MAISLGIKAQLVQAQAKIFLGWYVLRQQGIMCFVDKRLVLALTTTFTRKRQIEERVILHK